MEISKQRRIRHLALAVISLLILGGCASFGEWLAVRLFYREAVLPKEQVHTDVIYYHGPGADQRKHLLDFYMPQGKGAPVLVFVHGGGWRTGDKALKFGDADPYGNIGRFYAARGIGVAVINYRLQPKVTWRDQVNDVARALAWVYEHAGSYGGDKRAIFVSGHSSGAQLAVRAVLDRKLLRDLGLPGSVPCAVISVSGSPFDLTDEKLHLSLFEKHFRAGDEGEEWKREASSIDLVTASTPPFLLLHGAWEAPGLKRQNQLMHRKLQSTGVPARLVATPWEEHFLIVAALSREDKTASGEILDFIRGTRCAAS